MNQLTTEAPPAREVTPEVSDALADAFRKKLMERKLESLRGPNDLTLSSSWKYLSTSGEEQLDVGTSLDDLVKLAADDLPGEGDAAIWRIQPDTGPRLVAVVRSYPNGRMVHFF